MHENPFESQAWLYDAWYDANVNAFESEVLAIEAVLPPAGVWAEVGVGTGRFAARFGIPLGIEPSEAMGALACRRGIRVLRARAEELPLESESLDAVFFVTTLCFVSDLHAALIEACRVLRPGGHCVLGLLPADSPLGELIHANPSGDVFFRHATLRTRDDVLRAIDVAGLVVEKAACTLIGPPDAFNLAVQQPIPGHGCGSFVVLRARKRMTSPVGRS